MIRKVFQLGLFLLLSLRTLILHTFFINSIICTVVSSVYAQTYVPGNVYYGSNQYISYYPGTLPIIISAPHGGNLAPEEIPNRTGNITTGTDLNTIELAEAMKTALFNRTGKYPHIIICHLKRTKIDANRDSAEAAQGNPYALQAWYEFHQFIQAAKDTVTAKYGKGIYIDIHGHGHTIQRLELGYQLSGSDLRLADPALNTSAYINKSSVRHIAQIAPVTFSQLIRGSQSLGALFEQQGIPAIPSLTYPYPNTGEEYYTGGYNTERHGSKNGGTINGIQIECYYAGIRDTGTNRSIFATKFSQAIDTYLSTNMALPITTGITIGQRFAPMSFELYQNYPNPFNASTVISFTLSRPEWVSLIIYSAAGQELVRIVHSYLPAGTHRLIWDGTSRDGFSVVSGIYFCRLTAGNQSFAKKMVVIR